MKKHIFYLMGKSASGKNTIYDALLKDEKLNFGELIPYTTRPARESEQDGVAYHFTDEEGYRALAEAGKVIEMREYQTVLGPWLYFTVDEGSPETWSRDRLAIGTPDSYLKLKEYYGEEYVIPVYIEMDDGLRLERALERERKPGNRQYAEMCRRFLSDEKDFSEEKLKKAGIVLRFSNDGSREECLEKIRAYIYSVLEGEEDPGPAAGRAGK